MDERRRDPEIPFTRAEARAAGIETGTLRGPSYLRLYRNVYVRRGAAPTLATLARGALLIAPPEAVVSHHTAAVLWGGSVPDCSAVRLTIPRRRTMAVEGIRPH